MEKRNPLDDDCQRLSSYFTGYDDIRQFFNSFANSSESIARRFLVLYGIGGVGKSSLCLMLRSDALKQDIPVAYISLDGVKAGLDVLLALSNELETAGINLPRFHKNLQKYRIIQTKVEKEIQENARSDKVKNFMEKTVGKAGEVVGGAAGAMVGSMVAPGFGAVAGTVIGGVLGEAGADAWMSSFLPDADIDLLVSPTEKLTSYFLEDISVRAHKRKIVLIFDTLERAPVLSDWVCEFIKALDIRVRVVVAGQKTPIWDDIWPIWRSYANIQELRPLDDKEMQLLAYRYYFHLTQVFPEQKQITSLVRFAQGLPMVVTAAINIWVQHGVEDFQSVEPLVVAELVKKIFRVLPEPILLGFQCASTLRWFNKDMLVSIIGNDVAESSYEELVSSPFVRSRIEGLAIHDSIREIMGESLKLHNPSFYRELHGKASEYFGQLIDERNLPAGIDEDWQRFTLEQCYHLIESDESHGINLVHLCFGQGLSYFRYEYCKSLLEIAIAAKLVQGKSLHRVKYEKFKLRMAEFSPAYVKDNEVKELVENSYLDADTRWELLLNYAAYLGFTGNASKQAEIYKESYRALVESGLQQTAAACSVLGTIASTCYGEPEAMQQYVHEAIKISQTLGQDNLAYGAYVELGHMHLYMGQYKSAEESWSQALHIAQKHEDVGRNADARNRLAHTFMAQGNMNEAEETLSLAMKYASRLPNTIGARQDKQMYINRHFGIFHHLNHRYVQAIEHYTESVKVYRKRLSKGGRTRTLLLLAACLYDSGRKEQIRPIEEEVKNFLPFLKGSEISAGWYVLSGNLLFDQMLLGLCSPQETLASYSSALLDGLNANPAVLDEIINRIIWKVKDSSRLESATFSKSILEGLYDFWADESLTDKKLTEVEQHARKLFRPSEVDKPGSEVLRRIRAAQNGNFECHSPHYWLAF